jgi:hypothetical protein
MKTNPFECICDIDSVRSLFYSHVAKHWAQDLEEWFAHNVIIRAPDVSKLPEISVLE